jgi:alkyl sulfatase BDS1-like metallo-beta-lactamase superfamily hydrolase
MAASPFRANHNGASENHMNSDSSSAALLQPFHTQRPGSTALALASLDQPLKQIVPGIWQSDGMTNCYLITTSVGDVLVSTGLVVEGQMQREKFNRVSTAPVKVVILTQAHLDIVGGLGAFKQPDTDVIAHVNTHACQEDDARIRGFRDRRNPRFFSIATDKMSEADEAAIKRGLAGVIVKAEPTRTVSDRYLFTLGDEHFEVLALPGGETLDSLALWMSDRRIVFTGNVLGPLFPHMPNLHTIRGDRPRPVLPYLQTYQRILDLEPEILVTGHFEPIRGAQLIRRELTRLRDAVRYVHDETVRGMNEGKDLDALMREIKLPPELEVGEGYGTVAWAVQAIWYGYGGWFLYRSTTELYPTPVRDVYADVASLAGSDALAAAAGQKLQAGKPLEAIHLAEIALSGQPDDTAALRVYLVAHEQLLAQAPAGNRWYVYWLGGEIETTRRKLQALSQV